MNAKPHPHILVLACNVAAVAPVAGYKHPVESYTVYPGDAIEYDESKQLGKGNFGIVCMGRVRGVPAAVKVMRIKPAKAGEPPQRSREGCVADVIKEIDLMEEVAGFGGHPNLLKLVASDRSRQGPLRVLDFQTDHGETLQQCRPEAAVY